MSPWGLPPDAAADAHRVDDLLHGAGLATAVLLLGVLGYLVYAALRFRARESAPELAPESVPRRWPVLALAALFVVAIDIPLLVISTRDLDDAFLAVAEAEAQPDALRVQVNARQWAWDIRYAGPDGRFATPDDIVTVDDLRVPAGAPVVLQLASSDVVHSFFVPAFRVKRDAIPGRVNRLWFRPTMPGRYDLVCSEHCGVGHTRMGGKVTVLSRAAFDAWAARAAALSALTHDPAATATHWGWDWDSP